MSQLSLCWPLWPFQSDIQSGWRRGRWHQNISSVKLQGHSFLKDTMKHQDTDNNFLDKKENRRKECEERKTEGERGVTERKKKRKRWEEQKIERTDGEKGGVCSSCEQLTWEGVWCFWRTEKRPGPRVLTRGLAGVEPLWAEHHTVRRVEGGEGCSRSRWGRVGIVERGWGLDCPLTWPCQMRVEPTGTVGRTHS